MDFVFPFGRKINDAHNEVCALRNESRLYVRQRGLDIPRLDRSGRDIRISYHLQSVERSPGQESLEWSIRQTAVYHSYDLISKHALWINVKGNQVLEHRIDGEPMLAAPSSFPDTTVFSATLATHVVFAEWAGENWRTYIKSLESTISHATERSIVVPVDSLSSTPHAPHSPSMSQTPRINNNSIPDSRATSGEKFKPSINPSSAVSRYTQSEEVTKAEVPGMLPRTKTLTTSSLGSDESRFLDDFSFSDIQITQIAEETVEKVIGTLSRNIRTLKDLRAIYTSIIALDTRYEDVTVEEVEIFDAQIIAIENDLEALVDRSVALLKRVHERKALVSNKFLFLSNSIAYSVA